MSKIEQVKKDILEQLDLDSRVKFNDGSPAGSYFRPEFYTTAGFYERDFYSILIKLQEEGFVYAIGMDDGSEVYEEKPNMWWMDGLSNEPPRSKLRGING